MTLPAARDLVRPRHPRVHDRPRPVRHPAARRAARGGAPGARRRRALPASASATRRSTPRWPARSPRTGCSTARRSGSTARCGCRPNSLSNPAEPLKETSQMPEAVIVDAVRTPIGRAFKGSLAPLRPDDMGAFIVDQLLERNPDVDPASVEEVVAGVRPAAGQAGLQHRPAHRAAVGEAADGGQRPHRLALLRLGPRRDPHRRQLRRGRPGRHLHRRRASSGSRSTTSARRPRAPPTRTRSSRARSGQPERLHPDGRHGRERGQALRGQPRGHGQVRPALAGAGRAVAGGRLLRPRDRARSRCPTAPRSGKDDGPRASLDRSRSSPSCPRRSRAAAA